MDNYGFGKLKHLKFALNFLEMLLLLPCSCYSVDYIRAVVFLCFIIPSLTEFVADSSSEPECLGPIGLEVSENASIC